MGISLDTINSSLHSIAAVQSGTWNIGTVSTVTAVTDITNVVSVDDNGGSITVDAVNLDIRDLTSASDSVEIKTAAGQALAIDASGYLTANINGSVAVTATNLDIRDLAFASDSVTAHQGGTWSMTTNPGGFASWKVTQQTIDTTVGGTELAATPLTGRLSILVQNIGAQDLYIKEATGVTSSNGMLLPKGSSFEASLDDAANLFAIAGASSTDVRIVEYAA